MILAVCIILVFAVAAALLFDGSGNANLNGNSVADAGERADEVSGASYPYRLTAIRTAVISGALRRGRQ